MWTLFQVRGPILQSLQQLMTLYGARNESRSQSVLPRTERDAGVVWLIGLTVAYFLVMNRTGGTVFQRLFGMTRAK